MIRSFVVPQLTEAVFNLLVLLAQFVLPDCLIIRLPVIIFFPAYRRSETPFFVVVGSSSNLTSPLHD